MKKDILLKKKYVSTVNNLCLLSNNIIYACFMWCLLYTS